LSAARGFTTTPFTVVRARVECFVDLISIIEFTDESLDVRGPGGIHELIVPCHESDLPDVST